MAYHPGGQSVQGQTLEITVVGCYKLSDKEWFSRQDPYVVIEYSGQKFRTRTDTDGGKNPSFNESFKLALIEGLREINASVWNSNTIERDDYIGSTKVLLNKVIDTGYDDTQWSLRNATTGKSSGVLKLILHYAGSSKTKPGKHEGTSQSYGAPASQGYYGQPVPAYGPAVPTYGAAAHYPPQQPVSYPPSAGYCPPPVAAQAYIPVYQPPAPAVYPQGRAPADYPPAGAPAAYPPAPVAYAAPPPLAQPPYYQGASAPPYASAPAYPGAGYPPSGYPPAGYPPYRH